MKFGTICSGIGAPDLAWTGRGWEPLFVAENAKFPAAVLAHRFPEVPNHGDITKIESLPRCNVLCGGTPCQGFSTAGLRGGLDDPRSALALAFVRIAAICRAEWIVWENVPGCLSTNRGRDFGQFIQALGEIGYSVAWRVLDTQYVRTRNYPRAIPQRRKRVFLVGHHHPRGGAAVLFDSESVCGDPPPDRRPLRSAQAAEGISGDPGTGERGALPGDVAWQRSFMSTPIRCTGERNYLNVAEGRAQCLQTSAYSIPVIADRAYNTQYLRDERHVPPMNMTEGASPALMAGGSPGVPLIVDAAFQPAYLGNERPGGRVLNVARGITPTLQTTKDSIPLVVDRNGTSSTITASWSKGVSLKADYGRFVIDDMRLRNITPEEAERLQGFPVGWTDIPGANKSKRYTALGNSMSLNVLEWIAERIEVAHDLLCLDM